MLFFSYFLLYVISGRTAHRLVGYFEEEAVYSYTRYLAEVESGRLEDEAGHRDVNHRFASSFD